MEEMLEQLELVEVVYDNNSKKADLIFLDTQRGEIRQVTFNKQKYDKNKNGFVDSQEKAAEVEEWSQTYFNTTFDNLPSCVGEKRDVYCYEKFNSLWPVKQISKFDEDLAGLIFETKVKFIEDDGKKISIQFEYEDKLYESKMQYADYVEARDEWFVNPIKQRKQYEKFEEKFQIPVSQKEELIGKKIMCEVKMAFGEFIYVEIKPFPKKKKKTS